MQFAVRLVLIKPLLVRRQSPSKFNLQQIPLFAISQKKCNERIGKIGWKTRVEGNGDVFQFSQSKFSFRSAWEVQRCLVFHVDAI